MSTSIAPTACASRTTCRCAATAETVGLEGGGEVAPGSAVSATATGSISAARTCATTAGPAGRGCESAGDGGDADPGAARDLLERDVAAELREGGRRSNDDRSWFARRRGAARASPAGRRHGGTEQAPRRPSVRSTGTAFAAPDAGSAADAPQRSRRQLARPGPRPLRGRAPSSSTTTMPSSSWSNTSGAFITHIPRRCTRRGRPRRRSATFTRPSLTTSRSPCHGSACRP